MDTENTNVETGKTDDKTKRPEIMMNENKPDQRHADVKNGRGVGEASPAKEAGQYDDDEDQDHKPEEQVTSPAEYTKKEGSPGQDKSAAV